VIAPNMSRRTALMGSIATAAGFALGRLWSDGQALAAGSPALTELTAIDVLAGLKAREFTAFSYVEALLKRSEQRADLNVFINQDGEMMRAAAKRADERLEAGDETGNLLGLPVVVKDNINTAELPTTGGTPSLKDWQPANNAPVMQALLDAGALLAGKTNMHELAFGITSNNVGYGAVRNPYDKELIPGGSSGGTAAAVAARLAPVGLGSDTGGSCRIPAALCGCVGFRPTLGRYRQEGVIPISYHRAHGAVGRRYRAFGCSLYR